MVPVSRKIALAIFGFLVIAAPLLFGAVDRNVQIGIATLLGIGLMFVKPSMALIGPTGKRIIAGVLLFVLIAQFAPSILFPETQWHKVLVHNFGLHFPFTRHPEPARALDALLAAAIAVLWFLWVRTLADNRDQRLIMAWLLFISAAAVSASSLWLGDSSTNLIYGFRVTPGWSGFGPFPNRNHTACFLAMGALVGIGCVVRAARRKQFFQLILGHVFVGIIVVGLFESGSRGGLAALAVGLCVFSGLGVIYSRNRKAAMAVLAGAFVASAMLLAFGSKVMGRLASENKGGVSTQTRVEVWHDAVSMWKDAPIFGHGLDNFERVLPIYQTLKLDNQVVLHPESSWLLWLVELGLFPVVIGTVMLLLFLGKHMVEALTRKNGFFLRVGALAGVVALLTHSVWDVPAHRWATAGYGLAMLALACPLRSREPLVHLRTSFVLVPFAIAALWLLPYLTAFPAWSPIVPQRLLAQDAKQPEKVKLKDLQHALHYFPLDPELHEVVALRLLPFPNSNQACWQHFRVADRLVPSSWSLPATQARASRRYSTGMSLHFWTIALERSGWRADELFQTAYRNTSDLPIAQSFWGRYVENNPQLLLSFAQCNSDADAAYYFLLWWKERALTQPLLQSEIDAFYHFLPRWGTRAHLDQWMKRYPDWESRDFKHWASLLHEWNDDAAAWQILSRWIKEPELSKTRISASTQVLEGQWLANPHDVLNAQALVEACLREEKRDKAQKIIVAVAETDQSPRWFLRKAAYIYAGDGDFSKAVAAMLRGG